MTKKLIAGFIIAMAISLTITSCKKETNKSSTTGAETEISTNDSSIIIDERIPRIMNTNILNPGLLKYSYQYIQTLQNDTVKLVDSVSCKNVDKNYEQYNNDVLVYSVDVINQTEGKINADAENDFVISYRAQNCWNGIGAGNYLTNLFFVLSENGAYKVDEAGTLTFKQKFIDAVTKEYKDNYYKKAAKEVFMNEVSFKLIKDGVGNGDFHIIQCGAIPCVEGKFEYNFSTQELMFSDVKKNEYVNN